MDKNKLYPPLGLNTLKGHGDAVIGMCFFPNSINLATVCAYGIKKVFKLDALNKNLTFLRIILPVVLSKNKSKPRLVSQKLSERITKFMIKG